MRKLREGWGGEIWGKWLAELYSWGGHTKPQWGAEDATGAVTISLPCVFTLSFKIVLILSRFLTFLNMLSVNYQSIILCITQYQTDYISERNRRKFGGWMERLKFQAFIEELIPPLETQFIIVLVFEDKIHTPQCGVGGKGRKRRHCRRRNFGTDGRPTTNDRNHRCSKRSLRT